MNLKAQEEGNGMNWVGALRCVKLVLLFPRWIRKARLNTLVTQLGWGGAGIRTESVSAMLTLCCL